MPLPIAEPPLFDPIPVEKLRKIAGDIDPGFVVEMAQLFLAETEKSLVEIKAAADRTDARALSRLAHSLKSSAATLGLMKLSQACRSLELDTKDGEVGSGTLALVTTVRAHFEETIPVLRQMA